MNKEKYGSIKHIGDYATNLEGKYLKQMLIDKINHYTTKTNYYESQIEKFEKYIRDNLSGEIK